MFACTLLMGHVPVLPVLDQAYACHHNESPASKPCMVDMMLPAVAKSHGETCPSDLLIYKYVADCAVLDDSSSQQAELPL